MVGVEGGFKIDVSGSLLPTLQVLRNVMFDAAG
jgi:hypothetical protein